MADGRAAQTNEAVPACPTPWQPLAAHDAPLATCCRPQLLTSSLLMLPSASQVIDKVVAAFEGAGFACQVRLQRPRQAVWWQRVVPADLPGCGAAIHGYSALCTHASSTHLWSALHACRPACLACPSKPHAPVLCSHAFPHPAGLARVSHQGRRLWQHRVHFLLPTRTGSGSSGNSSRRSSGCGSGSSRRRRQWQRRQPAIAVAGCAETWLLLPVA